MDWIANYEISQATSVFVLVSILFVFYCSRPPLICNYHTSLDLNSFAASSSCFVLCSCPTLLSNWNVVRTQCNFGISYALRLGLDCYCSTKFDEMNNTSNRRPVLGKPTPSKWDDAQKWLVNLSKNQAKASPRNSNADDRRLMPKECLKSYEDEGENGFPGLDPESVRSASPRSMCLRDMGTEMTPFESKESSRSGTPIRAAGGTSPPLSPRSSIPIRTNYVEPRQVKVEEANVDHPIKQSNPLETQATAWDEAERAKYIARYKREEVKIQAWENHEKKKAEVENRKVEVKAERLKSQAREKYNKKLASILRIAEEKRANAESKLNDKLVMTCERADYIRRTGNLPSSFSFKLPSFCW